GPVAPALADDEERVLGRLRGAYLLDDRLVVEQLGYGLHDRAPLPGGCSVERPPSSAAASVLGLEVLRPREVLVRPERERATGSEQSTLFRHTVQPGPIQVRPGEIAHRQIGVRQVRLLQVDA